MSIASPAPAAAVVSDPVATTRAERAARTEALLAEARRTEDPDHAHALREQVVLLNRGVAESVAARYRHRGIPQEDLTQVAYEGLTKAAARFDPRLRHDFLSFAVPTIRGEVQRHFRDHGWTVRPPRRVQELQIQAGAVVHDLRQVLGREPGEDEVADALEVSPDEYREAVAARGCFRPASLDVPVGSESATLGDLMDDVTDPWTATEARVMLRPALRRLSCRDRRILYLRYVEDRTQAQIGSELGISQMQVSRLLTRILSSLRCTLEAAS